MGTLLLLLLVMEYGSAGHVIVKDPARLSYGYDEWKPVVESGGRRGVRYPVYRKSAYSYIPGPGKKKVLAHPLGDGSQKQEVFSPAPPSILGSFSLFGHATVNAKQHASHINKKSPPRPHQYSDFVGAESRPQKVSYQVRHQYPSAYTGGSGYSDFSEPSYLQQEASLRPPPHDPGKSSWLHPSPTSYYSYDHSIPPEKQRKTQKFPQSPYAQSSYRYPSLGGYSLQVNDFKTTVPPNQYESTYSYFKTPSSQIDTEYYNENPHGSVPLSLRRPEPEVKPVTDSNELLGRPFHFQTQTIQDFQTPSSHNDFQTVFGQSDFSEFQTPSSHSEFLTPSAQDDFQPSSQTDFQSPSQTFNSFETLEPFVSTYSPKPTSENRVKFSDVAQPFRVTNHENEPISSSKPETYTEDVYPFSVTTIDIPSETQKPKEIAGDQSSKRTTFKPSPLDNIRQRPYANSFTVENEKATFLPTPSTDTSPYISEPKNEITTINPEALNHFQESNLIPSVENKVEGEGETPTEVYTTIPSESTTKVKHKSRRPARPTANPEWSSTPDKAEEDVKYQRRRKPANKYRQRGSGGNKRTRTTTLTPPIEEPPQDLPQYTTLPPQEISPFNYNIDIYQYTGKKVEKPTRHYDEIVDPFKYEAVEDDNISVTERITTTSTTTTTTEPTTVQTTVTTSTESGSRVKSKYGSRPRFSVKDYRDKLNKATSTVAPQETERPKPRRNETEFKFGGKSRLSSSRSTTTTTELPPKSTTEAKFQKYKPRQGTSRYRSSTTPVPESEPVTTTTERSNTFRPSTNRYKPGTGKYYSRYRTSTLPTKELEETPTKTPPRITIRPKGVFSAKRQPFFKNKIEGTKLESDDTNVQEYGKFTESFKLNDNEVSSGVIKKMDDSLTTTISSGEEEGGELEPTGAESSRVADLTSSSSHIFQRARERGTQLTSSRPITLSTDQPILPLEAFFQTQYN